MSIQGCILISAVTHGMTERRQDDDVKKASAQAGQAQEDSLTGGKKILGGLIAKANAPLKRFSDFVRDNAIPYGPGFYIIRASRLAEFSNALAKYRAELSTVLDSLEPQFQGEYEADKVRHAQYFKSREYPSSFADFRRRFQIHFDIRPLPNKGEFVAVVEDNLAFAEAQFAASEASAKSMARENMAYKLRELLKQARKSFTGKVLKQDYLDDFPNKITHLRNIQVIPDADISKIIDDVEALLSTPKLSAGFMNDNPGQKELIAAQVSVLLDRVQQARTQDEFWKDEPVVQPAPTFASNEPELPGLNDDPIPETSFAPPEPIINVPQDEPEPVIVSPEPEPDEEAVRDSIAEAQAAASEPEPEIEPAPEPAPLAEAEQPAPEDEGLDLSGLDKLMGGDLAQFFAKPEPPKPQPKPEPAPVAPAPAPTVYKIGDPHPKNPALRATVVINGKVIVWS